MDITNYIQPELLILVPVLYLIGTGLKKSELKDKWIPLVLGGIAVVLATLYTLCLSPVIAVWTDILSVVITGIIQGILCAGASVYVNQIVVQGQKNE